MSSGETHDVHCSDILRDVYVYLDAECDREAKLRIKQHLADCDDCVREFGIEPEVKALVARCCSNEGKPDGLRERLRAKLAQAGHTSPNEVS